MTQTAELTASDGAAERVRRLGFDQRQHGSAGAPRSGQQQPGGGLRVHGARLRLDRHDPDRQAHRLRRRGGRPVRQLGFDQRQHGGGRSATATVNGHSQQGAAYVFTKSALVGADMTQTAKLTASDGAAHDNFGYAVSISGNTLVVGAHYATIGSNTAQGAAYVFTEPGSAWTDMTQTAKLTATNGQLGDCFGFSMAISDNTLAASKRIGQGRRRPGQGDAYIFVEPPAVKGVACRGGPRPAERW